MGGPGAPPAGEQRHGEEPHTYHQGDRHIRARPDLGRPAALSRIAVALDRLTDRIEAAETRTGLAISGIEHSVRHAMARIETAEREHMAVATRFDAAAEQLAAEQARAAER